MDLMIPTVIDAIFAVCGNGSSPEFNSRMVRKAIQNSHPNWRDEEAGYVSAKLQPQLNNLKLCDCIELVPSDRQRNKPWKLTDRARLEGLRASPDLIHHWLRERGDETGPEPDDVDVPKAINELLDFSETAGAKLEDIDNLLTASIEGLERQIESIRVETGQAINHIVQRLRHQEQVLAEFGEMLSSIRSHFRP